MLQQIFEDGPSYVNGQRVTCSLDGFAIGCGQAFSMLQSGSAAQCPNNDCGPRVYNINGQNVLSSPFTAYANGSSGFNVPTWSNNQVTVDGETTLYRPRIESWTFHQTSAPSLFSTIQWGPRTQGPAHSPQGQPPSSDPSTLKNLTNALDECVRELFQVKVVSFTPSERGKAGNGSFNFTDPNRRKNGLMGFGVVNDVTRYSIDTAPEDVKVHNGNGGRVTGFTSSAAPHSNYTLSNITNWLTIVKTQIHELGHSLEHITRNATEGYPQYDEAGWKLENCVKDKGGFKQSR